MKQFKTGDLLYNPKRGSKYIVVDINEYNNAIKKLFERYNVSHDQDDYCMPLFAITPAAGFHSAGEYIMINRLRLTDDSYSSDLDGFYIKIDI